jgi:capsular polysaccharide biosynthesis protein
MSFLQPEQRNEVGVQNMNGLGAILGNLIRRGLAYRWVVAVPAVLVFLAFTLWVTTKPDTYESHAILMPPITKPADGASAQDSAEMTKQVIATATERILSSKMLMKVADKVDPYPDLRKQVGTEAVIARLRAAIRIQKARTSDAITIFVQHTDGPKPAETATDIANTIADLFVEGQRDAMQNRATERVKFLRNQRAEKRKELDRAMKRLEEFKAKHVGTLPEDVVDNRMQADRLTAEITNYQRDQRMLRENIDALNRDLVQLHVQIQAYEEQRPMRAEDAITETKRILSGLRLELDRLLLTYQEDNLIVVQHRKYIEKVELRLTELQNEEKTATERTQVDYFKYLQDETRKQIARRYHSRRGGDPGDARAGGTSGACRRHPGVAVRMLLRNGPGARRCALRPTSNRRRSRVRARRGRSRAERGQRERACLSALRDRSRQRSSVREGAP